MEIKKGYTQTEIGLIPENWKLKTIDELSDVDPENLSNSTNQDYLFKYITLEDVDCGRLQNTTELLFKNAPSRARRKIKKGDILLGTVRPYLKSHLIICEEVSDWICSTGFSVIRCKVDQFESEFIYQHLFASVVNKQIDNLLSGSNYPSINSKDVKQLIIPVPPTKAEQTAIATALTDADALINSLEKLIAKKRNIKQGAMQELLKPKVGWEVKKLGEIFTITAGGDLDTNNFSLIQDEKHCYPIYSNALTNKGLYGYTSDYRQVENTITVTARGQVGVANPRDHKYSAIGRVIVLNPIIELNINFISEYINNFIEFSNESTGVPQLTAPQISKYEITVPNYETQNRIAAFLSDMDTEITALETKKDKYKMIKQGMMQNLLTGKIRLI